MTHSFDRRALISEEDLRVVAAITGARLGSLELEHSRLLVVRQFLRAAAELEHAVREQTRCALVNHTGTRGAQDLYAVTDSLFAALSDYAAQIREIAARFRDMAPELLSASARPAPEGSAAPATAVLRDRKQLSATPAGGR